MDKETHNMLLIAAGVAAVGGIWWYTSRKKEEAAPKTPALTPAPTAPGSIVTVTKDFMADDLTTNLSTWVTVGDKVQIASSINGVTVLADYPFTPSSHVYSTTETIYGA